MAKAAIKKRWCRLIAPALFQQRELGETPFIDAATLPGKTITANLAILTDEMRRQNTEVTFLIEKAEGDTAATSVIGLRLMPTSLRRFVRKGRSRLDEVLTAVTSDDKVVTIKVLLLTQSIVTGAIKSSIHAQLRQFLLKKITQSTYDALTEEVVSGKIHKEIRTKLKKTYPVKTSEILGFKLERFMKSSDLKKLKDTNKRESEKKEEVPEEPVQEEQIEQSESL